MDSTKGRESNTAQQLLLQQGCTANSRMRSELVSVVWEYLAPVQRSPPPPPEVWKQLLLLEAIRTEKNSTKKHARRCRRLSMDHRNAVSMAKCGWEV